MLSTNLVLRAQLAEIDAAIAELNSRLRVLERARWPIKRQLDRVVYPIATVPPEIMSEIFLRCLPPAPVESKVEQLSPHPRLAPLLLLRVCRTWKEIALSTPRLWDSLHLFDITSPSPNPMTKVVTDWFGRAGSSPLTLSLSLFENRTALGAGATVLSTILRPLAPRLKTLWLQLGRADELADIGPFPILETFTISYYPLGEAPLKLFSAAPRLHRLIFIEPARPSMFILPQAISEVTCDSYITIDELLNLLHDAPFLKKVSCLVHPGSTSSTFTHNHLETLHSNLHTDLGLLRLPALQTLHLSEYDAPADDFLGFLSSSMHLRHFRADCQIMVMSVVWFAFMPGLVDIDLGDPDLIFLSEFFAKLDRTTDPGFLPRLRSLTFRDCAFELDASVLQALSSRRTAPENTAMLESFQQFRPESVFYQDAAGAIRGSMEESTVYASRELVERGMSVHIGLFMEPTR
ncbi:hypothetical protein C8R46DRAFT_539503 [Mycena filopes]|nr:hypothetical protein C8R46DRAFT_539503 [Mycena filopes]